MKRTVLLLSCLQVRGRMQTLKEELFAKVNSVLEVPSSTSDAPSSSADSARRVGRDALAGRWRDVLDKYAMLSCWQYWWFPESTRHPPMH